MTTSGACPICAAEGTLVAQSRDLTTKKRPKFGVLWVLVTVLTGGLGLIAWLIWPRHRETIGVDRYTECSACKSRI